MNNGMSNPPTGWDETLSRQFIDYGRYFVPEREKQMQVIAGLLPIQGPGVILELCCGEGLLAEKLLERYPQVTLHGFDGSAEMLTRARARLARLGARFQARRFDLAATDWRAADRPVNGVTSSLAIHHLTANQKQELFRDLYRMLVANGVLVIADLVEPTNAAGRRLAAEMWDEVVR